MERGKVEGRLLGKVVGLVMRGDEGPDNVVLAEPVGRDLDPRLLGDLDAGQLGPALSTSQVKTTQRSDLT